jgi:hypothetical protein
MKNGINNLFMAHLITNYWAFCILCYDVIVESLTQLRSDSKNLDEIWYSEYCAYKQMI